MNNNELTDFINNKSWDLSKAEIEKMMDDELEKEPSEINTRFVECCLEHLNEEPIIKAEITETDLTSNRKIIIRRLLIAAAVLVLGLAIGMGVFAEVNNIPILDGFVSLFNDHASIDYSNKNSVPDNSADEVEPIESRLYKELKEIDIENILLPTAFYGMEYEEIEVYESFTLTSANISFINEAIGLTVYRFTDEKWVMNMDVQGDFTAVEQLHINGTDVYIFERNGDDEDEVSTSVSYQVGLTQYSIFCRCNIEQVKQLFESVN